MDLHFFTKSVQGALEFIILCSEMGFRFLSFVTRFTFRFQDGPNYYLRFIDWTSTGAGCFAVTAFVTYLSSQVVSCAEQFAAVLAHLLKHH